MAGVVCKFKTLLITLLISISFGVPALSFKESVTGKVYGLAVLKAKVLGIKPGDMVIYRLVLKVEGDEKPKWMPKKKEYLEVYSKKNIPLWLFGKEVTASIIYMGDEWGGKYWLLNIKEVE